MYMDCRKLNLEREPECPISYEDLSPCKTGSLSILRVVSVREQEPEPGSGPKPEPKFKLIIYKLYHMELDIAKQLYVVEGKTIDFETKTPIMGNMLGRIALQLKLVEFQQAGLSIDPTNEELKAIFDAHLKNPAGTSVYNRVLIGALMHMDHSGLSEWIDTPVMNFRDLAIAKIKMSEPGSWLLRKASVEKSDVIIPRCITFKNKLTDKVDHAIIAHVYGFGYTFFPKMARGYKMPHSNKGEEMPTYGPVYESFIAILESMTAYIDLEKMVPNS